MEKQQYLPPFESITSVASKITSFGYGLTMIFGLIISVGLFVPIFFIRINEEILFGYIFIGIPLFLISFYYIKNTLSYTTIIIDSKGIKYFNKFKEKMVNEILWEDFESINKFEGSTYFLNRRTDSCYFNYDVASQVANRGRVLFYWFVRKNGMVSLHKETFHGKHIFSFFYTNRLDLVRSLLLGIRHFRPDLRIHPLAYGLHYINPKTFEIDYGRRTDAAVVACLIMIILAMALFFIILFAS